MNAIEQLADLAKRHLRVLFAKVEVKVVSTEIESMSIADTPIVEDVGAVEVDGTFLVYPIPTWQPTIGGKRRVTAWQVDALVDDSDPSVGMYSAYPERLTVCRSESEAIATVAAELARLHIDNSLAAEYEALEDAAMADEEAMLADPETPPEPRPEPRPVPRPVTPEQQKDAQEIISFQDTRCFCCGKPIPANTDCLWVMDQPGVPGGILHTECAKAAWGVEGE